MKFLRRALATVGTAVAIASEFTHFLPAPVNLAIGIVSGILTRIPTTIWNITDGKK